MKSVKVFDNKTSTGASDSVDVFIADTGISPPKAPPYVMVNVVNAGSNNASINVEWSPGNLTWFSGTTYTGPVTTTTGQVRLDRIENVASASSPGVVASDGDLDTGNSAMQFAVKGRYCRLNIVLKGTTIDIDAWISAG